MAETGRDNQVEIDPMILGIDHLEFFVADARLTAHFYAATLGLRPLRYTGPEVAVRDQVSIVMGAGAIHLVLTTGLEAEHPSKRFVDRHGDGVRDVAFRVRDVEESYQRAIAAGARSVREPSVVQRGSSRTIEACVSAMGDVVHSLVERPDGAPIAAPEETHLAPEPDASPLPLKGIDHIAICGSEETLRATVASYADAFGLVPLYDQNLRTETSAMNSRVVGTADGAVKLVLIEPVQKKVPDHLREFLHYNSGPGVQHVALCTTDIVHCIRALRRAGVRFLRAPDGYHDGLEARVPGVLGQLPTLRELDIMVDRDAFGLLYQIFTRPIHARPTFFLELIQRDGAVGFGSDNVKALFQAADREIARRRPEAG
ncbi:MAG: 4-hydroxyphenylpyruvate dioxygenase [Polyangiaceae bacterium]|nr:4-hydroxyphenylpyruvate dioxygenase [Polyangiaceae bacterium]